MPAVGIASRVGPFQLVPGALDELDDDDRAAGCDHAARHIRTEAMTDDNVRRP